MAATLQGVAGFGFTLLAASFFLLVLESAEAIQLLIVINLAISGSLVARLRKHVPGALFARLVAGSLVGLPVGLLAFTHASVTALRLAVGTTVVLFTVALFHQRAREPHAYRSPGGFRTPSAVAMGILSGALTTSLGMPGPPVIIYLTALRLDKQTVRAASLTFLAVCYSAALVLQVGAVEVARPVWVMAAVLLPSATVGALIGHLASRLVSEEVFRAVALFLLAATGGYMLITTLLV